MQQTSNILASALAALSFVPVSSSMREVADSTIATFLDRFSHPAFDVFERVSDDSIERTTTHEIDGVRFTFDWPANTRRVQWCVKSRGVTVPAFILLSTGQWPVQSLTSLVTEHTRAWVFASADKAKEAVAQAVAQFEGPDAGKIGWLQRNPSRESVRERVDYLRSLVVRPILAAADEIACGAVPALIARKRLLPVSA